MYVIIGRLFKLTDCGSVECVYHTYNIMISVIRRNLIDLPTSYSLNYY